jgi:hypothetical protein
MNQHNSATFTFAGWCAYGSALVSAVGVVFAVLLYIGLLTPAKALVAFGPLNDVCILAQYALALPIAFAVHRLLRPHSQRLSAVAATIGIAGMIGVIVFQALLLAGLMGFRQQVVYASASILLIGVWLILIGAMGRRSSDLGGRWALFISAALYFGYPLWAYWLSRRLLRSQVVAAA